MIDKAGALFLGRRKLEIPPSDWSSLIRYGQRRYSFQYNPLGWLTNAAYGEGAALNSGTQKYDELFTFDKNGNIKTLKRYGLKDNNTFGLIDDLNISEYIGNQVRKVSDAAGNQSSSDVMEFKYNSDPLNDGHYVYYATGALMNDYHKRICMIKYNYLTLPKLVQYRRGDRIEYVYDAHYYLNDRLGNHRIVMDVSGTVKQVNNYHPSGTSMAESPRRTDQGVQPYKFGGKELDRFNTLDHYDFEARAYDPVLMRFTRPDPLAEKYYSMSPYCAMGNNTINRVDLTGRDWYQYNETKYYTWYDGNEERKGYTYIGKRGSVLGEFESIIDGVLTDPNGFNMRRIYSEGFTFDIAPNDKGGLLASKERGWDFTDEFAYGVGPEFSVFLSDHPYTEAMKTDKTVLKAQQMIAEGKTDVPGQITNVKRDWYPWNVLGTTSIVKQFIGSYRYDAFTSSDGTTLNNLISDSKSRSSFFLHLPISNKSRSQTQNFANTYQFYIWKSSQ